MATKKPPGDFLEKGKTMRNGNKGSGLILELVSIMLGIPVAMWLLAALVLS